MRVLKKDQQKRRQDEGNQYRKRSPLKGMDHEPWPRETASNKGHMTVVESREPVQSRL